MSDDAAVARGIVHEHGMAKYYWVWGILLMFTAVEVELTYQHLQPLKMLLILLSLSLFKAALIILYFMHLSTEATRMKVALMSALLICLCLMFTFFPDSFRIIKLGPQ